MAIPIENAEHLVRPQPRPLRLAFARIAGPDIDGYGFIFPAALLMVAIGVTGAGGVAAVLGVAAVVCCASAMAGDMIQDLKVGHLLGGTPWKMEVAEMISTVIVAFVLIWPMVFLHAGVPGGIGGDAAAHQIE